MSSFAQKATSATPPSPTCEAVNKLAIALDKRAFLDPENIPESAVDAIRDQPFLKNILPQAKEEKKFRMPAGSETVKEEIMADGSRKYITTKWHKDGTTTVTEEIQQE